jgi:TonB family protein
MNKAYFFFLTTILFVGIFANVSLAQTAVCAVKINVKSEDGILVKGTTATAMSYDTKKLYRAVLKDGMPFFPQLTNGGYEISMSKAGFKKSVGGIPIECKLATDILEVPVSKGDSKEVFDITVRLTVGLQTRLLTAEEEKLLSSDNEKERLKGHAKIQGILNFDAVYLEKPQYPAAAQAIRASGVVTVQITVNEKGKVESAEAVEGHPLLQKAAVDAAKKAKFNPLIKDGKPIKFSGKLIYNFISNRSYAVGLEKIAISGNNRLTR